MRPWPASAVGGSASWVPMISSMYFTVSSSFVGFAGCPQCGNTGMTNGEAADRQPARRIFSGPFDPVPARPQGARGLAHPAHIPHATPAGWIVVMPDDFPQLWRIETSY